MPTKLDQISAETVGVYLRLVNELKSGVDGQSGINPGIALAGVVGMMTLDKPIDDGPTGEERRAWGTVRRGLQLWQGDHYIFERDIQDSKPLRNVAGREIVTAHKVPKMFSTLGDEVKVRINLK